MLNEFCQKFNWTNDLIDYYREWGDFEKTLEIIKKSDQFI